MKNNSHEQVNVLIESMFTFADQGIDPSILCETTMPEIDSYEYYGLLEDTAVAAGLFSKLNQGRKDLVQKIQNIDWKEWVKKMKETLAKIWRFITAPARTLKELVTGKTTLKQIGERIKTVWKNLRNKKDKTPEEKEAEPKLAAVAKDIEKAEEKTEEKIAKMESRRGPALKSKESMNDQEDEDDPEDAVDQEDIKKLRTKANSIVREVYSKAVEYQTKLIKNNKRELLFAIWNSNSDAVADDSDDLSDVGSALVSRIVRGKPESIEKYVDAFIDRVDKVSENPNLTAKAILKNIESIDKALDELKDEVYKVIDLLNKWIKKYPTIESIPNK